MNNKGVEIEWRNTAPGKMNADDWVGEDKEKKYMLRAERMDRGVWWWCVYLNKSGRYDKQWSDEVASSNDFGEPVPNEKTAKQRAEEALEKWIAQQP